MNYIFRKAALAALCVGGMAVTLQAEAANWLMLQGTEPEGTAPRAKLWGFVQPTYSQTEGSTVPAGAWKDSNLQPNMIAPDLKTNKDFYLQRARFAIRGNNLPLDSKINYFLMAEMGNNGITAQSGSAVALTDASVTLNHIPHARVRVGQFKTPMSEEVYQGIMVMDYINFTNMANQQLVERFFATDGQAACTLPGNTGALGVSDAAYLEHCADGNQFIGSVGAARDIGVQLFDTFQASDWEHSYSLMYGNGNGINRGDNDDNKDLYLYWSSEKLFGGAAKGPWREGWKLYAWNINGKRTVLDSAALNGGTRTEKEYDRKITGIGTTFRKSKYRAAAEYITFDGMIYNGSTGAAIPGDLNTVGNPQFDAGARVSLFNVLPEEEADGWYLDFGYKVMPKLELDVRYDIYNRGTKVKANERTYETTTLGAQWFFNKKTRFIFNYEIRNQDAPGLPSTNNANKIADELDNRLSMQVYAQF